MEDKNLDKKTLEALKLLGLDHEHLARCESAFPLPSSPEPIFPPFRILLSASTADADLE